ncbi:M20/M25/M40 family metallo-hydrolase [Rossellomorea marisflavi]|uniref:M20/M25/M40 family metallo-hydrolase n=1 Tax=Rossellomorea marisflavi TaxID=189381 RepID=A0A5D4RYL0_9BACI|nr:M20/M25/M40 family metallo-hydrolase [Rossellomorea marisflavi]TYS54938.1 M20/M25/M40 family metallo-hydrolase [Rossellomorea marisflavi]
MTKTWNQLFIRHGWLVVELADGTFDFAQETDENRMFLQNSLKSVGVDHTFLGDRLTIFGPAVEEELFIEAINFRRRGIGEGLAYRNSRIADLDVYVAGVVRQLNRLGFKTVTSCDGHGMRRSLVVAQRLTEKDEAILSIVGFDRVRPSHRNGELKLECRERNTLLDVAERLAILDSDLLKKGPAHIQETFFQHRLEHLLEIPGDSGNESEVRVYVMEELSPLVDHLTVDHAGNILAERTYRNGNGPTILLNAHLDTVEPIEPGRNILKDGPIWSSSRGILGADDRAGVAILLELANMLHQTSCFSGKVKFIFTVQEECGLLGAREVSDHFLWGTDAAFVVDRRGTGDIVTSCGGTIPFCDPVYGNFLETLASGGGLEGWKAVQGGSSDTRIWASHGIQSVNLSVGYRDEHTEEESLDVSACYSTLQLLKTILQNGRQIRQVIRQINRPNILREAL